MHRAGIVTGAAAACAIARAAHADAPARLIYAAPAGCPDAAAFAAAVHERAPRAAITPDGARTFTVTIAAADGGFTGTLATPDATAPRSLAASRCDDLAAALALVTALAIDPSAADASIAAAPAPPVPRAAPPVPPPRPVPTLPRRFGLAALIAPEVELGLAPGALPAATVEARLIRRGWGHADLGAVIGRETATTGAGDARFTWRVARVSGCWSVLDAAVGVDACADASAGELEAAGVGVVRAQDLGRTWIAVGLHAALRIRLTSNVFAELRAGAAVPLARDRFYFTPDVLVHQTAAVTPWVGVGVGARFW